VLLWQIQADAEKVNERFKAVLCQDQIQPFTERCPQQKTSAVVEAMLLRGCSSARHRSHNCLAPHKGAFELLAGLVDDGLFLELA